MAQTFYGSRDEADAYHLARGNSVWGAATPSAQDAALIRASCYIDGRYRNRFSGRKAGGRAQGLEWPRLNASDTSGEAIGAGETPAEVVNATYEAALREVTSPGSLSPDVTPGRAIKSESKGVGPLTKSVTYADAGTAADLRPVLSIIDDMLSGLLTAKKGRGVASAFLMRA